MSTNLFRRGATYYVRVATPRALQDLRRSIRGTHGSREVLRSLGTKDLARAPGRFNTESCAREELIAETASMLLGERLAIGFDPSGHAAYVSTGSSCSRKTRASSTARPRRRRRRASSWACLRVREPLKAVERAPKTMVDRPTPRRRPRAQGHGKPRERAMAL